MAYRRALLLAGALAAVAAPALAQGTCSVADADKQDCYPWMETNATACAAHGCCYNPSSTPGVPWCYYQNLPAPVSRATRTRENVRPPALRRPCRDIPH
jgi:hypothetical protein